MIVKVLHTAHTDESKNHIEEIKIIINHSPTQILNQTTKTQISDEREVVRFVTESISYVNYLEY